MADSLYLGIDTSNYTSSCAVYDSQKDCFDSRKQLLPVADGQLGLRQSDAVFHHNKNLPPMLSELCRCYTTSIGCVSYSRAPRDADGSYMPCFTVGEGYAAVTASLLSSPCYAFSHQAGHVAAAVWSSGHKELIGHDFLAFHVSGGTTDVLLVHPDAKSVFRIEMIASSLDLKAGQAVDRVGGLLGLPFPAGPHLDKLACRSDKAYRVKPFQKDGSCSFSGVENRCEAMLKAGEQPCDIAKYCLDYIDAALTAMTESAKTKCAELPVLYAGGVMSNSLIRKDLTEKFGGYFADPYYSSDNAAGTAYLGFLKETWK